MTTTAHAGFQVTGWDEQTYEDLEGRAKLTRADVTQTFSGDIEGEGAVTWLMAYTADDAADYVGIQRITGRLGGREGTVVLTTTGRFDGKVAAGTWSVVAGSGRDGLAGISGSGEFSAPLAGEPTVTLDYDLA
ncbi:MAG TPA: DUF3224 domain-containing protein [Actinomycetes bacterium]